MQQAITWVKSGQDWVARYKGYKLKAKFVGSGVYEAHVNGERAANTSGLTLMGARITAVEYTDLVDSIYFHSAT